MAEDKSLEELEREITCSICQEHYTEPKILPCQHYYCKQCVLRLAFRMDTGQPFSCPECCSEAILPDGDVDQLKTAFNINRLKAIVLSIRLAQSRDDSHKKCCLEHKEPLTMYCFDCKSLVCEHCTRKGHCGHDFELCKLSSPSTKAKIQEKLKVLKAQKQSLSQAICTIQTARQEIETQGEVVAANIQKSFKELREVLDNREQELLQEAARIVRMKINQLSTQEEKLSVASADIQSIVEHTEQCVGRCTDSEVMSMHTEIKRQIQQKIDEHSKAGRSLALEEVADIQVEVRCRETLQQLCQTQANIRLSMMDPTECTIIKEEDKHHKVNKVSTAILRLPSNAISRRRHKVSCSLRSLYSNNSTQCQVDPTGAGQYSIQYTPTVRGCHELTVFVNGQQVAGSPFPVFVSIHPTQLRMPVKEWRNFTKPIGIAVNSKGEILVSGSDSIIKIDRDEHRTELIDHITRNMGTAWESLKYRFSGHNFNIAIDNTNKIYCFCKDFNEVLISDQSGGNYLVKVITHVVGGCMDLAIVGDEVMICGKNNRGVVTVYDKNLDYKRFIGRGNNQNFIAISADRHGNIYCTDRNNSCICVFNNNGIRLNSIGIDEKGVKKIINPHHLCVSGDYVYVCDVGTGSNISVFTTDGVYVTSFGDFPNPRSICSDIDGFVYVASSGRYYDFVKVF